MLNSNVLIAIFYVTALALILVILLFRLSAQLRTQERIIRTLPSDLARNLLPAIESASLETQNSVSLGSLKFTFPVFLGGPSIDSFHARYLIQHLVSRQPKVILELGSGSSTLIIARTYQLIGIEDHVHISIDHEAFFLDMTKRNAELNGVAERITFRHCPLEKNPTSSEHSNWYSGVCETLAGRQVDLVVIDGPPAYEEGTENARYPALPMLHEHLSPNCTIIVDDANRPGEKSAVKRWKEQYPEFQVAHYTNGKGIAVLTR